jgi:hypothetical protein
MAGDGKERDLHRRGSAAKQNGFAAKQACMHYESAPFVLCVIVPGYSNVDLLN